MSHSLRRSRFSISSPSRSTGQSATIEQSTSKRLSSVGLSVLLIPGLLLAGICPTPAFAQDNNDISAELVLRSINRGKQFLLSQQLPDGSWMIAADTHQVGITSLATLALINAGMTKDDPRIRAALKWLRRVREPQPTRTYETSLMIMAFAAAKDGGADQFRISKLASRLERAQVTRGVNAGGWGYEANGVFPDGNSDRSNAQYAVLGLRDAAQAGYPVKRRTWELVQQHWLSSQSGDGGWGYSDPRGQSTGTMTVAGIASLSIASTFLRDKKEMNPDGTPICCVPPEADEALDRANRWMARNFSVRSNPRGQGWWLYYMYGLERAGRLSGQRFFGDNDWYREGVRVLLARQSRRNGAWRGDNSYEGNPILGTSFSLLFLSKGLAPVLINKLKYGPRSPDAPQNVVGHIWNKHPHDARNISEHISTRDGWPKLVTWQVIDMDAVTKAKRVEELLQAPILYITGDENISSHLSDADIEILADYILQGGFIFASASCQSPAFDQGIREVARRMYPDGSGEIKPLEPDHPIFRSEYLLDPGTVTLEGLDIGCRTALVYAPDDLGCLWDKWTSFAVPNRPPNMKTAIAKAIRIGVNVIAYATGRELKNKLDTPDVEDSDAGSSEVERGYLKIAKIRHNGDWDAAPQAVKNLLTTLNKTVGIGAVTKPKALQATDPNLFRHAMIYMHGQRAFQLSRQERDELKKYLSNGGVLFADSCCGAKKFDRSFRETIKQMFPKQKLTRIPADHEMFSKKIGHDLSVVRRRGPQTQRKDTSLKTIVKSGEPFFEGIEIDGRFAVIYSKFDISCALERQTSVACEGYVPEDAVKLATNVVLYTILQDARYSEFDGDS